jgi:integrase
MAMIRPRKGANGQKRWQWRVTLKGYPPAYGTCPTKECARECARRAEEEVRAGKPSSKVSLRELIERYEELVLPGIPDSAVLYRQHLGYWKEQLGALGVRAVTPQVVAEHKARLAAEVTCRGRVRAPATVNRYLNTLAAVFTWACKPEVQATDHNPVRDVERLREPKGRVRFLSRPSDESSSELERLLAACAESNSEILLDLVTLLLSTGCRVREVLEVKGQDIRLAEGGFTIPPERAKTEEARFVPLDGIGLEVVRRRLAGMRPENPYIFPGAADKAAFFPNHAWRAALRRARIENLRPHDLRHTHGSYLAMMGKTLPEIMQALGHKDPRVSLRYVHLADAHKRQVSQDINARLSEWLGGTVGGAPNAG